MPSFPAACDPSGLTQGFQFCSLPRPRRPALYKRKGIFQFLSERSFDPNYKDNDSFFNFLKIQFAFKIKIHWKSIFKKSPAVPKTNQYLMVLQEQGEEESWQTSP